MSIWRNKMAIGYMLAGSAMTLTGAALMNQAQAQGGGAAAAADPFAQQQPPGAGGFGGGGFGGQPPQGGFPGGPGGFQGGRMPMMGMGGGASITATDRYVYVLRGDTLYQFTTDGLKLLAKAEIPRPEPPQRQPRDSNAPQP